MLYFGPSYRQNDYLRQEYLLDKKDLEYIQKATFMGAALLAPLIPCIQSDVNLQNGQVELKHRCKILKGLLIIATAASQISVVVAAFCVVKTTPTAN